MNLAAKTILVLGPTLFVTIASYAQTTAEWSSERSAEHRFSCSTTTGLNHVSVVAGPAAPYSAVEESSNVQTLSDGTHISQKPSTEKVYRDSQGRTRTEVPFCPHASDDPEAQYIQILDPVSGSGYILDQPNHVAHRYVVRVLQQAGPPPPKPMTDAVAKRIEQSPDSFRKFKTETLGTDTIEGVLVEGTRTTETVHTGMEGNDRPMAVIEEVWTSPELKLTMLTKCVDPRYGEHTSRVTNLDTSEPSPLLFQPPPDYKIVDETDRVTITYKRP
jgi:hypothetical protein